MNIRIVLFLICVIPLSGCGTARLHDAGLNWRPDWRTTARDSDSWRDVEEVPDGRELVVTVHHDRQNLPTLVRDGAVVTKIGTRDGQEFTGVKSTADSTELVLRQLSGDLVHIPRETIDSVDLLSEYEDSDADGLMIGAAVGGGVFGVTHVLNAWEDFNSGPFAAAMIGGAAVLGYLVDRSGTGKERERIFERDEAA